MENTVRNKIKTPQEGARTLLTFSTLETYSMQKLYSLCDKYAIETVRYTEGGRPAPLSRCELLGELAIAITHLAEDSEAAEAALDVLKESKKALPYYNATEVEAVIKNPSWVYIYWNISRSDNEALEKAKVSELKIRVGYFDSESEDKSSDFFDFSIEKKDAGRYILVPKDKKFLRVDLLFYVNGFVDILASSKKIALPFNSNLLEGKKIWEPDKLSPILKLSGIEDVFTNYYKVHLQTFS